MSYFYAPLAEWILGWLKKTICFANIWNASSLALVSGMSAEASEILPQYNWRTSKNYEKANLSALYSGLEVNFLVHWQSLASKIFFH